VVVERASDIPFMVSFVSEIENRALFDRFKEEIARLPEHLEPSHLLSDRFRLHRDERLEIYYAPFDHIAPNAKLTAVGVAPGWSQMKAAFFEARRALGEDIAADDVLRRAKYAASFSGPLRANLVSMLDQIGLDEALGISSTRELFEGKSELFHPTSAVRYPVFVDNRNYTGSKPPLATTAVLVDYVETLLASELMLTPDSVVLPLGKSVESALRHLIAVGNLEEDRCLFGFPHPSGANAHRVRQFEANQERLASQVASWFLGQPT
jgi:hypothetical protein